MMPDPRTVAALETLIGFNTVSRHSNLECIDWTCAHLETFGAHADGLESRPDQGQHVGDFQ